MATIQRRLASMFRSIPLILAAAFILSPLSALAEPITFTQTAAPQKSTSDPINKKLRLALDDDGNVMVRFKRVSLTFIYEGSGAPPESRLQSSTVATTRQEVACLGGLSVKLGMTF